MAKKPSQNIAQVQINTQKDLEAWLAKNHTQKESVWLVFYKKTSGKAKIIWSEIVDSLICYGWIDSLGRKLDAEKTMLRISPRNPKSFWSKINRDKVKILNKAKRIQPSGKAVIAQAKANGAWDALKVIESLTPPPELAKQLNANNLLSAWNKSASSKKRMWLEQLLRAKQLTT